MMAVELLSETMLDEPGGTLRTLKSMSAFAAQRQRCIASSVEKQQGLLLTRQRFVDRVDHQRTEPTTFVGRMGAHIDRLQIRHFNPGKGVLAAPHAYIARCAH